MSDKILIVFILEFLAMFVCCVMDRNWALALYAIGGAILNIGVLWGMRK